MTPPAPTDREPFTGPFKVIRLGPSRDGYISTTFRVYDEGTRRFISTDSPAGEKDCQWLVDRLNAAQRPADAKGATRDPQAAQDGGEDYVPVPREPTRDHIDAFFKGWCKPVLTRRDEHSYYQGVPWMNGWEMFLAEIEAGASASSPARHTHSEGLTEEERKRVATIVKNTPHCADGWMRDGVRDLLAIIDRLTAPNPGFTLMPNEPTMEMLMAADAYHQHDLLRGAYRAMRAAWLRQSATAPQGTPAEVEALTESQKECLFQAANHLDGCWHPIAAKAFRALIRRITSAEDGK